jgi:hypothetical protein
MYSASLLLANALPKQRITILKDQTKKQPELNGIFWISLTARSYWPALRSLIPERVWIINEITKGKHGYAGRFALRSQTA